MDAAFERKIGQCGAILISGLSLSKHKNVLRYTQNSKFLLSDAYSDSFFTRFHDPNKLVVSEENVSHIDDDFMFA